MNLNNVIIGRVRVSAGIALLAAVGLAWWTMARQSPPLAPATNCESGTISEATAEASALDEAASSGFEDVKVVESELLSRAEVEKRWDIGVPQYYHVGAEATQIEVTCVWYVLLSGSQAFVRHPPSGATPTPIAMSTLMVFMDAIEGSTIQTVLGDALWPTTTPGPPVTPR